MGHVIDGQDAYDVDELLHRRLSSFIVSTVPRFRVSFSKQLLAFEIETPQCPEIVLLYSLGDKRFDNAELVAT